MSGSEHTQTFVSLRSARLNRGLSVRKAAAEAEVAPLTFKRLEKGERVEPASAKKVADCYGVDVTDLMPSDGSSRAAA